MATRLRSPYGLLTFMAIVGAVALSCDQYRASPADDALASAGMVTPELTPAPSPSPEPDAAGGCGELGDAGAAVVIEPLRKIDRSCVPPADAIVYRCDPALDPMAVLDADGEDRAFLGGSFAVPILEIPQEAIAVGFGPSGRFYAMRDDERFLYVESGATPERWLALARPRKVTEPPIALMVGDSILDGATPALTEALAGWDLTMDALVGRSSSGGISVVEGTFSTPDVVVVELGTNDHDPAAFRANADRILAAPAVAEADLVVWLTARNPDEAIPAVNREIVEALGTLPHGVVADWDRAVPPEALNGDGVHLAPGQEGVFADFVEPILATWRAAVHHRGPASCDADVREAVGLG